VRYPTDLATYWAESVGEMYPEEDDIPKDGSRDEPDLKDGSEEEEPLQQRRDPTPTVTSSP